MLRSILIKLLRPMAESVSRRRFQSWRRFWIVGLEASFWKNAWRAWRESSLARV